MRKIPKNRNSEDIRRRAIPIESKINESLRSIELSFSSNKGIRVFDWWNEEWVDEILDHSSRAVDLTRLSEIGVGLFQHDPDQIIGRLSDVRLDETAGKCYCRLTFDTDERAELVYQKVKSGTLKGVSVGYRVYEWEKIKAGEEKKGVKGPAVVARKWEPVEVSIVSIPADPTVGVGRSIKNNKESDKMNFREKLQELLKRYNSGELQFSQFDEECRKLLTVVDPDELPEATRMVTDILSTCRNEKPEDEEEKKSSDEEDEEKKEQSSEEEDIPEDEKEEKKTKRAIADERKRSAEISAVCAKFGVNPAETARFISEGVSVLDVYRKVSERSIKNKGVTVGETVVERGADGRDKYRAAAVDGLRMRTGARNIDKPASGAEDFRNMSLLSLACDVLERNGESGIRRFTPMELAARAFSTSDFPAIMSNLADVTLMAAYTEVPQTWRAWCRVGSANDFKAQHRVRMGELPELEPVLEGGEYKMADLVETQDQFSIGTFGKKFALTRQAIINDDLGAFTRIPMLFGAASARTINRTVYRLLKSNPAIAEDNKPVFDTAHKNLGAAAALSIGELDKARTAMRRQQGLLKDKNKINLNITPTYILIPPELETLANQILTSDTDIRYANANVKNPFRNALTSIVEAELEAYEWYLLAQPSMIDTIEVAFLSGMESPTLEQQQGWNVDGIEYKVRLDFGAWLYEYRGMYKNPGAQPPAIQTP